MQKLKFNKKILFIVTVLVACLALLAVASTLPNVAFAAGNNSGNYVEGEDESGNKVFINQPDISMTLDVNGKDAQYDNALKDTTKEHIATYNGFNLRRRYLSSSAVVLAYNEDAANRGHGSVDPSLAGAYMFVTGSIYNSSSKLTVSIDPNSGNTVLIVEALSITNINAQFTVKMRNGSDVNSDITVSFSVQVVDTFAHRGSNGWSDIHGGNNHILLGGKLNADLTESNTSSSDSSEIIHGPVLTLYNNQEVTLNLEDLLVNRALYCNSANAASADMTKYLTPITQASGKFWPLHSVSNFEITGLSLPFGTGVESTKFNPTSSARITPLVTFSLHITTSNIVNYRGPNGDYTEATAVSRFWSDIHRITLTFKQLNGNDEYTLEIPVNFYPRNPQVKNVSSEFLNLNVTSGYTLDVQTRKYYNSTTLDEVGDNIDTDAGYNAVILRATDLIEFSFPEEYGGSVGARLCFIMSTDSGNDSLNPGPSAGYSVTIPQGESTNRPERLIIKLNDNGNYSITFVIEYFTAVQQSAMTNVTLSFKGYGKYTVTMPALEGKREVSYNALIASQFQDLLSDGFQLTAAEVLSDYRENMSVDLQNNVLKLSPNVSNLEGREAKGKLRLTFTNTKSQKVVLDTNEFNIDIRKGSFWARFEDWEGGLIIAAASLAGLLLILLIVWLFIRAVSKRKQDEYATQAPVSSYIVKLNATIAATQAQQRMSQAAALSQSAANTQMLLTGTMPGVIPDPNTLQLASGVQSTPAMSTPAAFSQPGPVAQEDEDLNALIARYITDDELLERIYTEKYEPKGMVRRTFFKSKDLQARELEKEKKRIIDRYKSPMPMDEAIMSETTSGAMSTPSMSTPSEAVAEEPPFGAYTLDFDPDSPLYAPGKDEFVDEKIDLGDSPEEVRLNECERQIDKLSKELAELTRRLSNVRSESDKNKTLEEELREKIAKAESDDAQFQKDIEDLEFKLASAKSKEKDKITRDIKIKEEQKDRNGDNLAKWRADLESLLSNGSTLSEILQKLESLQAQKTDEQNALAKDYEKAQADFAAYKDRLEQVRARQELDAKVGELTPLLVDVNTTDYELRDIQNRTDRMEKEREELKGEVATYKTQILGANDFDIINDLNTKISDINARLSDIEKDITKMTKRKSELNLDLKAQRRRANDYCEKNDVPVEEVVAAEDKVIGGIELDLLRAEREASRNEAEQAVANAQAVYDDLAASSADVTMVAMEVAANIKDIEDELEDTQKELDEINAQMEEAGDDEKLMLMVDQGDKSDKIEELKAQLKAANVEGTKRKMEAQAEYDEKLEAAHVALDQANEEFKAACARCDAVENTNPLDLVTSGSGIISQDQKKFEAENLKKQLEKSKNEIEQARLAAEMAQAQAEQARLDAENATAEARAEAERKAREAAEAAEAVRLEAEERARAEAEAAERARAEAAEAIEQAKREAEEAAERARLEAEAAAERARKEAEEAAAEKLRAEAEAAEAKRLEAEEQAKAEAEEAERVRREQEEAIRAEAEEAKRKAQEEVEEIRRKAEEEAEAKRLEEEAKRKEEEERQQAEAARAEEVARKVAARKEKIINFRDRMKDIKNDDDAKNLREQLYSVQLTFDEDERGSQELMDFYNKTMDDIQHAGEVATLKAENAKKPKRVVRKVTERVNRIPKRKPGAAKRRPSARPAGKSASAHRAAPSRSGARPAPHSRTGARPAPRSGGSRPTRPR